MQSVLSQIQNLRGRAVCTPWQRGGLTGGSDAVEGEPLVVNFIQSDGTRSQVVPSDNMAPCCVTLDIESSPDWNREWLVNVDWDDAGSVTIPNEFDGMGFPTEISSLRSGTHDPALEFYANDVCGHIYSEETGTAHSCTVTAYPNDGTGPHTSTFTFTTQTDTRTQIFVATAGSDGNDGLTSSTPVQTLAQVETLIAAAGGDDCFVRLNRGDTFTASSGSPILSLSGRSGIVMGAYGTGAEPIIAMNNDSGIFAASGAALERCGVMDVMIRATNDVVTAPISGQSETAIDVSAGRRFFLLNAKCRSEGVISSNPVGPMRCYDFQYVYGMVLYNCGRDPSVVDSCVSTEHHMRIQEDWNQIVVIGHAFGNTLNEHQLRFLGGSPTGADNMGRGFSMGWCKATTDVAGADARSLRFQFLRNFSVYQDVHWASLLQVGYDGIRRPFVGGPFGGHNGLIEGCAIRQETPTSSESNQGNVSIGLNAGFVTVRNHISYMDGGRYFLEGDSAISMNSSAQQIEDILFSHCTSMDVSGGIICRTYDRSVISPEGSGSWGPRTAAQTHDGAPVDNLRFRGCLFTHDTGTPTQQAWLVTGMDWPNGTVRPYINMGQMEYNYWPGTYSASMLSGGRSFSQYQTEMGSKSVDEEAEDIETADLLANGCVPEVGTLARDTGVPPSPRIQFDFRGVLRDQNAASWPAGAIGTETP